MHLEKYGNGTITLSVVGFLLNTVMLVILSTKKRKKAAQVFLINLCVADILISVFAFISGISPYVADRLMDIEHHSNLFKVFTTGILFSFSASLPTCWTITFDRLFAIIRPLRHAVYYTPKKIRLHIVAIWAYATLTTVLAITGGVVMSSMMVIRYVLTPSLLITIILLIVAYTLIIKAIVKNNRKMAGITHSHKSSARNSRAQKNKRIYIHSLVLILNFTICSSPYVVFSLLHSPLDHDKQPLFMSIATKGLTAIPVIDSLSYFFLNLVIRKRKDNGGVAMQNIAVK